MVMMVMSLVVVVMVLMLLVVMVMMMVLMLLMVMVMMMVLMLLMVMIMIVVMMAGAVGVVALLRPVGLQRLQRRLQRILLLHGLHELRAAELIPGSGDDHGLGILLPDQLHRLLQLFLVHALGPGQDDGAGALHLVVVEFAEVLHVDPDLSGVADRHHAADLHLIGLRALHRLGHVRELAHAGGLDQDPVGMILRHDLLQRFAEVAHQRAADAAGVHLRDLDARLLKEAAVDADLAELVLDQHDLLSGVDLLQQLLDERGLACAQESGENIDFCH